MLHKIISGTAGIAMLFGTFVAIANADHSWGGYHWARTANPLSLKLGDNLSATWDPYLATASVDWSASTVIDTAVVSGTALRHKSPNLDCSPVVGTVQVCSKTYGKNGWLGLASVWVTGGHITKGTVKVNDTYFNTTKYNKPAWRDLVMCQEVGHTIGLDHQDEAFGNVNLGTCMDYTNAPSGGVVNGFDYGPSNEHPNFHDYEMLEEIYAHVDSVATAFASTVSAGAVTDENPGDWGRAIKEDAQGRNSLYMKDLGRGNQVFTFVVWAN